MIVGVVAMFCLLARGQACFFLLDCISTIVFTDMLCSNVPNVLVVRQPAVDGFVFREVQIARNDHQGEQISRTKFHIKKLSFQV